MAAGALAACGGGGGGEDLKTTSSGTSVAAVPTEHILAASAWTQCAVENGTCKFTGTRNVKYGTTSAYVIKSFTGSASCNNATFGDPAVGQWKSCWYDNTVAASTWTQCAEEDGTCTFTGTRNVRYGTSTSYFTKSFTGSVSCNNATFGDPAPGYWKMCSYENTTLPVSKNGEWTGVTASMWSEINSQRAAFGDTNDCQARVNAIPVSGGVTLKPGADINAALANNNVVFLSGGTYTPTYRITVPAGKKLIGVAGQVVTINAANVGYGAIVQNNAVLANLIIDSAQGDGVTLYHGPTDTGSTGALVYQVSSRRSGYYNANGDGSSGIRLTQNAANNCVVSSEAFDTWNVLGAPNDHGGNSDGINNSYGANNNSFIDVHSYRNGDDGIDMWEGGQAYFYFSSAHDNGKTTGKSLTGDGNGIKLGTGSVAHKFYKTTATNNKSQGFDLNGNTVQPVLVQSTASGNPGGDYGNGVIAP